MTALSLPSSSPWIFSVIRSLATRRDQGTSLVRRPGETFFFSDVCSHVKDGCSLESFLFTFPFFYSSSCSTSILPQPMADDERHTSQMGRLQTWPFRRRHPAYGETANGKADRRWHDASELDLTRHESLSTIFVTDSSKTLDLRERTISEDLSTASIHKG